jgi:hypothetical protein
MQSLFFGFPPNLKTLPQQKEHDDKSGDGIGLPKFEKIVHSQSQKQCKGKERTG